MQGLKVKFDESSVTDLKQNFDNLIKELENKSTINIKFNQDVFKNIDNQVNQVNDKLSKIGKINISTTTENIDNAMNQTKSKLKETETILDRIRNKYKNVGEEVNIKTPFKIDATNQELTQYAKAVAGIKAEWTKCTPSIDSAGNKIKEVNVRTKESGKYWHNYSMILDESTGKIYKVDKGLSDLQNRQLGLAEKMKVAAQSFFVWMNITNLFYQGIHKLKEGIEFINDLNKMQTNIQMITGMDRGKIQGVTKDFSDLAGTLHSTQKEVLMGAENFLRAGKSISETRNLLESATIGGKISGQETKVI